MSDEEKRIDRLWWRAWATNKKLEAARKVQDRRDLARHLESIEDELEQFLCEVAI
jgi:hypothetical protein